MSDERSVAARVLYRLSAAALAASIAVLGTAAPLDPARDASWQLPEADLYGLAVIGQRVWAAGYWGTVLRSEDGGRTWTPGETPTSEVLFGVSFADAAHGWAVGARGVILRTTDGGETWTRQVAELTDEFGDAYPLETSIMAVSAVGPDEAWAVGDYGAVLHTTDGESWQQIRLTEEMLGDDNMPDRILNDVSFSDPDNGWIAGEFGTVVRTTDGGATWVGERHLEDVPEDLYLFALSTDRPGSAAIVGLAGSVLVSDDGGLNWMARGVKTGAGLYAVGFRGQRALVAGDRGVLFVSQDGGRSWVDTERPRMFRWLRDLAFVSESEALVVGEGGMILRSEDGGLSWSEVARP